MAPLRWTKRLPTTEGHYWCRCFTTSNGIRDFVVRVYSSTPKGRTPDTVFWDGENLHIESTLFHEWSDKPIPTPED